MKRFELLLGGFAVALVLSATQALEAQPPQSFGESGTTEPDVVQELMSIVSSTSGDLVSLMIGSACSFFHDFEAIRGIQKDVPTDRMDVLLNGSEDLRQMEGEWRVFWMTDQPSHMTYERVHGGIDPDDDDESTAIQKDATPPTGAADHIVTVWQPKVFMIPDPARNGEPGPGVVGRVYLHTDTNQSVCCDGELIVDLYDDQPEGTNGSVLMERWVIDKGNLKKMIERDESGWGYTLFLPSQRCKPGVTSVHLKVTFKPESGKPVMAVTPLLHLSFPEGLGSNTSPPSQPTSLSPNRGKTVDLGNKAEDMGPSHMQYQRVHGGIGPSDDD